MSGQRQRLLVLSSTYPRWRNDPEPAFVHELAKRLAAQFEVHVLCPHAYGAATIEQLDGVNVHRYRYAPARWELLVNNGGIVANLRLRPWLLLLVPGFLLSQAVTTWWLVRRLRPVVMHAHWLIPQGLVVAGLGMLCCNYPPFLLTSHGADLFSLRGRLFTGLKRFVLGKAAGITVVSAGMQEVATGLGIHADDLQVAPMGVDLQHRFFADTTVRRSASELLFVGRLVEKKGLRHLLDAMPMILAKRPDVTLSVVGFGPEAEVRKAQAQRLGIEARVNFVGAMSQAELPDRYRRAAVFVAPFVEAESGDQEGLGLVCIEALGCGCPVVASNLPGTRKLPVTLVKPGAPRDLAAAILAQLELTPVLRDAESRAASELLRPFDWTAVAERYASLLQQIASQMPESRRVR
jgi:glycosyltransferase involved in cell wall biosynthesis